MQAQPGRKGQALFIATDPPPKNSILGSLAEAHHRRLCVSACTGKGERTLA